MGLKICFALSDPLRHSQPASNLPSRCVEQLQSALTTSDKEVIDSDADINIVSRDVLERLEWSTIDFDVSIPRLLGGNEGGWKVNLVIVICVRLRVLTVRSYFVVAESLPVPPILGTTYIDNHIRDIIPPHRKIVPRDSP